MRHTPWRGVSPRAHQRPFVKFLKVPRVNTAQYAPTLVLLSGPEAAMVHYLQPPVVADEGLRPCEGAECPWCKTGHRKREQCYAGVLYRPDAFRFQGFEQMPAWCVGVTGVNALLAAELLEHGRGIVFRHWMPPGSLESRWEMLPARPDLAGDHQLDVREAMDRMWGRLTPPPAALFRADQAAEDLAPPSDQVS